MIMATPRKLDPRAALDYPTLDPALFVCWAHSRYVWPDARRVLSYLSKDKAHTTGGFALFTTREEEAATFPTKEAADVWLSENEGLRPAPYGVKVSTVAELIERFFPDPVDVVFRAVASGEDAGTVEAFFPEMPGTNDPTTCTVYAHVGQHGSAAAEYYRECTRPATDEESAALKAELARVGYVLNVVTTWTPTHDEARAAALRNSRKA